MATYKQTNKQNQGLIQVLWDMSVKYIQIRRIFLGAKSLNAVFEITKQQHN